MAYVIYDNYFPIEAISFSPSIVASGQEFTYSITMKNASAIAITEMKFYFQAEWTDSDDVQHTSDRMYFPEGAAERTYALITKWNEKTSRTFTGKCTLNFTSSDPADSGERVLSTSKLKMHCNFSNGTVQYAVSGPYIDHGDDGTVYFQILDKVYAPTVKKNVFKVERKNDDTNECLTTLQLSLADGLTDIQKARMSYNVYVGSTDVTQYIDKDTFTQAALLTGITKNANFLLWDDTISGRPTSGVPMDADYKVKVTFGDQYEMGEAEWTVMRCFANLHLSGDQNGGVCIGGFCGHYEDDNGNTLPRFECHYPAYFYGGIAQGGINMQHGVTTQASHANGTEETVTFSPAFSSIPAVVACVDASASNSSFGGCFVAIKNITTDGFTIRYANTSGSTRTFAVQWIAIAV